MKHDLFVLTRGKISNFIFFLIFILPIFRYYNFPGTSLGSETLINMLILLLLGLLCLMTKFRKNNSYSLSKSRMWYVLFVFWGVCITLIYETIGINARNINNLIMALVVGLIILLLMYLDLDITKVIKIYELISITIIIILILQWILLLSGTRVSFKMPFHEFNESWNLNANVFGMNGKMTSLFSEPAHLCEYLFPYLCICLFEKELVLNHSLFKALITSFVILSSISGTGIVITAIIWILYFTILGNGPSYKRIVLGVIGIVSVLCVYLYLSSVPEFEVMMNQLFTNENGELVNNKSSYRIYRGWDYFFKFPIQEKVTGVGFSHMYSYTNITDLHSIFDNRWKDFEWFSAITEILLYFGIIGAVFFFLHIKNIVKVQSKAIKSLMVVLMCLLLTSQILFLETHLLYISIIIVLVLLQERKVISTMDDIG